MASHDYKIIGTGQEEDPRVADMIEEAEREIDEARVNVRFGREQLETVRRAAALKGVPYQIYIKEAVYERAFQDLSARIDYELRKNELLGPPAEEETQRLHALLGISSRKERRGAQ